VKRSLLLVLAPAILLASCAERRITPNEVFNFKSQREQQDTERRALAGDNAAAKRMGEYCIFIQNDRAAGIRWYKLAASRGDKIAKQNVKELREE
jgi:ABC-type uncharacterized transport system auxiliary subunit